jgi:hypothetical protein
MKAQEIDKLKQLDPQGLNGTISSVLLDPNINQAHYADVLYYLVAKGIEEKSYFERVVGNMMRVLKAEGLHKELNECLELEEKL